MLIRTQRISAGAGVELALALVLSAPCHASAMAQNSESDANTPSSADVADVADVAASANSANSATSTASTDGADVSVRPPYRIGAGFLEQFNASLDDGGRFGASRAYLTGAASFKLMPVLELSVGVAGEYAHYRFTGSGPFDPKPWSNIVAVSVVPRLTWSLDPHWAISLGAIAQYSGETGADFGDSLQWGGVAAVRYAFDRDHIVGVGLLVLTQLEDDPLFIPVPLLDWHFGDGWRVSNIRGPEANPFAGLELVKELDRAWEVAGGAGWVTRRFRLDNEGPAPRGVGNDSGVPVFGRLTFRPQPWLRLDLVAGVSFLGRIELLDSDGDRISVADADPAPILGIFGSIRF